MPGPQWARLQADLDVRLRRGAWYRVIKQDGMAVVLEVNRQAFPVVKAFLDIITSPPRRWTVVPRPENARKVPREWGTHYAVCPYCRGRAPLKGQPRRMTCDRCHGEYEVAWNEDYLLPM